MDILEDPHLDSKRPDNSTVQITHSTHVPKNKRRPKRRCMKTHLRRNRIHPDSRPFFFPSCRLGNTNNGMLARTVDAAIRFSHQSRDGRGVDYGAASHVALRDAHVADLGGHAGEGAVDVDAKDCVVVGGVVGADWG